MAEVPVVGVERELWFYGHADNGRMGASSPVASIVPLRAGVTRPTAAATLCALTKRGKNLQLGKAGSDSQGRLLENAKSSSFRSSRKHTDLPAHSHEQFQSLGLR